MKKLLLSLLLMPGVAIKAAEPVAPVQPEAPKEEVIILMQPELPQEAKKTDPQFNIEFLLENAEDAEQIRELLKKEKEKGTLTAGIQETFDKFKLYDAHGKELEKDERLVKLGRLLTLFFIFGQFPSPQETIRVVSAGMNFVELLFDIANEGVAFGAASMRRFSDYSVEQASYLMLERCFSLVKLMSPNSDVFEESKKEFKKNFSDDLKTDFKELNNCIRAHEMPDKIKDRECFFNMFINIVDRQNQPVNFSY
jgi:hypothetical protein